jgi:hypothetical protein
MPATLLNFSFSNSKLIIFFANWVFLRKHGGFTSISFRQRKRSTLSANCVLNEAILADDGAREAQQ